MHVVGVQLIGLASEPADGLEPVDEVRFDLRAGAFHLALGRSRLDQRLQLDVDERRDFRRAICPGAAVATSRKNPPSSRELWYAETSSATRRS